MQQRYADIVGEGAEVVAVSTDNLNGAEWAVSSFGSEFPILYTARDPSVPQSFGVFNLFGDGLAAASIFLLTEGNEIRWQDIGQNYRHRVDSDIVLSQLRQLEL